MSVDVGDAIELTFSTKSGAIVVASWFDPDNAAVIDDAPVMEAPPGSGRFSYMFLGAAAGIWHAVFRASGVATQVERFDIRFMPVDGPAPLATVGELVELFRPLSAAEQSLARALLRRASALLRGRVPDLDARVAAGTLDAEVAGLAAINMVLRVMRNPAGLPPLRTETIGPFTRSFFSDEGGGLLTVTAADMDLLAPAASDVPPAGTIMVRPGLARWPTGVRSRRDFRRW